MRKRSREGNTEEERKKAWRRRKKREGNSERGIKERKGR